jgi:hypothetical protein
VSDAVTPRNAPSLLDLPDFLLNSSAVARSAGFIHANRVILFGAGFRLKVNEGFEHVVQRARILAVTRFVSRRKNNISDGVR